MGTSTPAQAAAKLRRFANDLDKYAGEGVNRAALEYTTAVRRAYRLRTGDGRLSGVGVRGARVGARYDRLPGRETALVRATGPAHLIEGDTKAHVIVPRKRRGKRAVATPYGPRASVQHPGTRGRPTFFPTVYAKTAAAAREFAKPLVDGLHRTFQ